MKNKMKNKTIIFTIIMAVIAIFSVVLSLPRKGTPDVKPEKPLEGICFDGEEVQLPVRLNIEANEKATITVNLSEEFVEQQNIFFRSTQQTVDISLDHKNIYHFGVSPEQHFGKAPPSHWNIVELPEISNGKTLTISFTSPYEDFSGRINNIYYGTRTVAEEYIELRSFPNYLISWLLLMCALFGFLFFIFTYKKMKLISIAYLSICMLLFAIWSFTECQTLSLFVGSEYTNTMLSFLTVMLFPVPYVMYIRTIISEKFYKITDWFFYIGILMFLAGVILQVLHIKDLVEIRMPYYILLTSVIISTEVMIWHDSRKNKTNMHNFLFVGIALFLFFILADFYLEFFTNLFVISGAFTRIGIIIYIVCLAIMAVNLRIIEMEKAFYLEKQSLLMEQQFEFMEERLELLNANIHETKIYRHDLRHYLQIIDGLVQNNDTVKINDFIQKIYSKLDNLTIEKCKFRFN